MTVHRVVPGFVEFWMTMLTKESGFTARIEIDCETLARLLGKHQVQACELRCLDAASKKAGRQLMLTNCMRSGRSG